MNEKITKEQRAATVVQVLKARYPAAECALQANGDAWRLLVLARLSAQCTDARVNRIAPALFAAYPDCAAMAEAELPALEKLVFSCGVYRVKAQNLRDASRMLCERFDGQVPSEMEALLSLPGVGRKIANLLRGDVFGLPAIVADTHCIRIANRLGLADSRDPVRVEKALCAVIPPQESSAFCHRIVLFGREICAARAPRCAECPLAGLCREPGGKGAAV